MAQPNWIYSNSPDWVVHVFRPSCRCRKRGITPDGKAWGSWALDPVRTRGEGKILGQYRLGDLVWDQPPCA